MCGRVMSIRRGRLAGALTNVSLVWAALGQVNPTDLVTAEAGAIDLMRQTAASQASPTAAQAPTVVTDNIVLRGTIKRDFVVPDRASNSEHGTNTSADAKFQCQEVPGPVHLSGANSFPTVLQRQRSFREPSAGLQRLRQSVQFPPDRVHWVEQRYPVPMFVGLCTRPRSSWL